MSSYHTVYFTVPGRASGVGKAALHLKVRRSQRKASSQQASAVQKMIVDARERGSKLRYGSAACPVIFFRKPSGKGLTAVQRCEHSKTFKTKSWREAAKKRAKKLCHVASGANKGQFRRCRGR